MKILFMRIIFVVNAFFISSLFSLLKADIYVYIDIDGNQHFSEHKVNREYKLLLRSITNRAPSTFKNWKEKDYSNVTIPKRKVLQRKYHLIIVGAAQKYQLEAEFLHAVITAESNYKYNAISSAGAQGLMQLMPETAKRFGVDNPFDAKQNIYAGASYLKILLKEFETKDLALAAYNAGEGTVRRYDRQIPPYPETQGYVEKVMKFYHYYKTNL